MRPEASGRGERRPASAQSARSAVFEGERAFALATARVHGPNGSVVKRTAGSLLVIASLAAGCTSEPLQSPDPPVESLGPAGEGGGVRVFSGFSATLEPSEGCTGEEGSGNERWCGFVALSSEELRNLYVVNVSQVIAGVPVTCGEPDPNCLLLTEDVGGSGANWHATYFEGDTLVYYDATLTPYVWRPGWDQGRLLAVRPEMVDLVFCSPAERGTAVACLALPYTQEDPAVRRGEIYVGRADGESEPLLSPLEGVITSSLHDQDGVQRFSYGFPAEGYVAWSTRSELGGPEVLKLQRIDDPESRIVVAEDVHDWDVSADGASWFWLSGFDSSRHGTLQRAAFPDGSQPVDLIAGVADFGPHGRSSVVALTEDSDVVSIPDPRRAPETQLLIAQGMKQLVELGDHGHLAYSGTVVQPGIADLFVSRLDGTQACLIEETVSVPLNSVHFSSGPEAAVWARANPEGYDAFSTRLSDCSSTPVASNVTALGWVGKTIVFMDQYDENGNGVMHFRRVDASGQLGPDDAVQIAEHIGSYASAGEALIYSINADGEDDGVYVRAFAR